MVCLMLAHVSTKGISATMLDKTTERKLAGAI